MSMLIFVCSFNRCLFAVSVHVAAAQHGIYVFAGHPLHSGIEVLCVIHFSLPYLLYMCCVFCLHCEMD